MNKNKTLLDTPLPTRNRRRGSTTSAHRLTVGSLFSGIGGLDLGLERAGMEVRWQVEKNAFCQRVLMHHWPDVPRYEDVTTLTGEELAPVDLVCGGFPCQPVSQAGQQKGTDDDRWLWPEFQRIVGLLRPRYVLVENVTGLLTANGGHAFGEVIGDLADLGMDAEWTCLSAKDCGAPHLRKRVWIVAYPNGTGLQRRQILSQCSSERSVGKTGLDDRRFLEDSISGDWEPQSRIRPLAHGVPSRVAKLQALGNAVVPKCAEVIGRYIVSDHAQQQESLKR
jgi:DNA (cytosine-5)-methyltransferase 1